MPVLPDRTDFPAGFIFGAATSAFQIEGSGFGGAGPSQWGSSAAIPGTIADQSDGVRALSSLARRSGSGA